MSQSKRNNGRRNKPRFDVGLEEICGFLRFIWVASGALFIIAISCLILFTPSAASYIAYVLTILCCGITAIVAFIGCAFLEHKEKEIIIREKEKEINTTEQEKNYDLS